ncbi:MAG: hypothetical protein LC128_11095 [Chitinophagales bacterium]|nr:hypothetical protein [Chitinophagales bacterium]
MIKFFQILFLVASIVLIVLNVIHFNKYRDSKRIPNAVPHPIRWFDLILTTLVALGCALNIIFSWIGSGK